jgi:hypothetical protein
MLCNNYNTENAYVNNNLVNVKDYIINKNNEILCKNNHQLIFVDGKKVKKYFRHKNSDDLYINSKMTDWHKNWQIPFEHTEIPFNKLNEAQIKDRRCDILIDDYIIEIQHSKQTEDEVNNRFHDYTTINNKQIIWIIDGENSIVEKKDNRIIIEINEQWKIDNYKKWDFIFLDINKIIYKIYPNVIKNKMIDCNESYLKKDFINILKNDIQKLLDINIPKQCNLYLKQQGAGNGKTYGIIQQINNNDFEYNNYVLITKQHSAAFNIYDEFKDQEKKDLIQNLKKCDKTIHNKKRYIIEFEKNNIKKTIIIGTVDSLFYAISNNYIKKDKYSDIFRKMVEEVCNGLIVNENINNINYSKHITLHKKLCLIIDETQDLDKIYAQAIKNIMVSRYVDCYIVGDLLQSIEFEDNAFKYLLDYQSQFININKLEYSNLIRRFNNKELIKFVNYMVDFEKYNLPKIQCEINTIENKDSLNLKLIETKNKDDDIDKIYCNEIMNIYEQEINNGYKKEDILIITPIVSKGPGNKIMIELETRIRQYWNNILDDNQYKEYAKFHKSEEGSSIDLKESKESTRLISIKTSKGLGHKVVIVFGLSDKNLYCFSKSKKNLIYDSMIHVALTRMKEKLHVLFEDNKDSISNKIIKYNNENYEKKYLPNLTLSKNINYKNIIDLNQNNDFRFDKNIEEPLMEIIEKLDSKIIDMSHHQIRYSTMISYILIRSIHSIEDYEKQQNIQLLKKIYKSNISLVDNWKEYKNTKNIPIFELKYKNTNSENKIYNNILYKFIKSVKIKCNDIINKKIETLCSFEMIILHYLLGIVDYESRKYSTISPIDIYNIINAYYKSFSYKLEGHNYCLCKKVFNNNNEENEMQKYLSTHYDSLKLLDKQFTNFIKDKQELKWLYNHTISLGSNNNDYWVHNNFEFICYNNKNVYFISLKPQLNNLNFINNMISLYFNNHLIKNINIYSEKELEDYNLIKKTNYNSNIENYIKFGNKNIIPIIISLNNKNYISPNFGTIDLKNNIIISLYNYMINDNKVVYYLFKYYYDQLEKEKPKHKICNIINNIKIYINYGKDKCFYPNHLIDFLNKISNNLENIEKSSERKKYLNSYLNIDKFIEEYSLFIKKSIDNYLNEIEESSDESSDEED